MNFRVFLLLLVMANMFGFLVGMLTYYDQMAGVNPLLWVFIPDCPLYVLLATLFFVGVFKNDLLRCITAMGLVKYGIWTEYVLLGYGQYLDSKGFLILLGVEHIGMILQFFLVAKQFDKKTIAMATGWFLLNDYVDYWLGLHPYVPNIDLPVVAAFTISLSLLVPLFTYWIGGWTERNAFVNNVKKLVGI
ncbi:MAG: DUF1405 domain-containing protein [Candidatus ainarchaeum sp.]|nr:DUF1405 domain-containing protein [Candidatus ainarchaeum sp.]